MVLESPTVVRLDILNRLYIIDFGGIQKVATLFGDALMAAKLVRRCPQNAIVPQAINKRTQLINPTLGIRNYSFYVILHKQKSSPEGNK